MGMIGAYLHVAHAVILFYLINVWNFYVYVTYLKNTCISALIANILLTVWHSEHVDCFCENNTLFNKNMV